jgi:quercetin dioxygenase-like cupin family protein
MTVPAANRDVDFFGVRARVLTDGSQTDGHLGLVELIDAPPGDMPPLHIHHTHDEGFYPRSGELTVFLPGKQVKVGVGDFFLAPPGIPHTYRVSDDGPATWLVTSSPAGFERFVAHIGSLEKRDEAEMVAIAATYGIEILGPPGAMP